GSFTATATACGPPTGCSFTYQAKNSQNSLSKPTTATLTFLPGSNLNVTVQDAKTKAPITDYKWIIEQDLTFHIDPRCQQNNGTGSPPPATCPPPPATGVPRPLPTNFPPSYTPVIATGCTAPHAAPCSQSR